MNAKQKKPVFRCINGIVLLMLLVMITQMTHVYMTKHRKVLKVHKINTAWDELEKSPGLSSPDDELVVHIRAVRPYLKLVRTIVTLEGEEDSGFLSLTISDSQGQTLGSWDIDLALHGKQKYMDFATKLDIEEGELYTYRFSVRPQEEGQTNSTVYFALGESANDKEGNAFFNGQELQGVPELQNRYLFSTYYRMKYIMIANVLILLVFLFGRMAERFLYRSKVVKTVCGVLLFAVTPLALFYMTQRIVRWRWTPKFPWTWWALLFYCLLYILFCCVAGKVKVGASLYVFAVTCFALANYFVNQFRGKPLTIFDFTAIGTAATVAGNYTFGMGAKIAVMVLGCLMLMLVNLYFQELSFPRGKKGAGVRALIAALSIASLLLFDRYQLSDGWITGHDFWSMNTIYSRKGYLPTILSQLHYLNGQMPEGYNVEETQQYGEEAEKQYTEEESAETVPTNLIVIMNESFWDPETMGHLSVSEDPIPYWHSLLTQDNVDTGLLYVPVFGAGTANSEYEVLTGNTLYFLPSEITVYETYCADPEYGMASSLKSQGYGTIAMHPNKASAWNRGRVYPWMQFDTFYDSSNWPGERGTMHGYTTDASVYQAIEDLTAQKAAGEKQFIFTVTIQNHGGYESSTLGYEPDVQLQYNEDYPLAETYLSLMKESDRALQDLISCYEQVEEPTMIVMFGDHQPKIEDGVYKELKKKAAADVPNAEKAYVTSYMIWTNYDRDAVKDKDISTNYLGAWITRQAGLQLTAYQKFLLETMERMPQIGYTGYRLQDGSWHTYDDITDEAQAIFRQYGFLQYNNVNDRDNRLDQIFALQTETGENKS